MRKTTFGVAVLAVATTLSLGCHQAGHASHQPDELGTGQSQVLALAFAYAYAMAYGQSEGTVLVIDEPEANLHPLAQHRRGVREPRC